MKMNFSRCKIGSTSGATKIVLDGQTYTTHAGANIVINENGIEVDGKPLSTSSKSSKRRFSVSIEIHGNVGSLSVEGADSADVQVEGNVEGTVNADSIKAKTINADRVNANSVEADIIRADRVNANTVNTVTVHGDVNAASVIKKRR